MANRQRKVKESFLPIWPQLDWWLLWPSRAKSDLPFPFSADAAAYFYFGRNALAEACRLMDLREGDKVLLPAYGNDLLEQVFASRGVAVEYFDVGENFEVSPEAVAAKIDEATRAVMLIHYFGWPQSRLKVISNLCRERGLFLIEDCALSPVSFYQGRSVGTFGDVSIFSLKKYLPVPNGGVLVVNRDDLKGKIKKARSLSRLSSGLEMVSLLAGQALINSRLAYKVLGGLIAAVKQGLEKLHQVPTGSNDFQAVNQDLGMSSLSNFLIKRFDFSTIRRIRRSNYEYLSQALVGVFGQQIFSSLSFGVTPLFYPLLVERDAAVLVKDLRRAGVGASLWWQEQGRFQQPRSQPVAEALRQRVVALPIHQSLNRKKVDFMIEQIKRSVEQRLINTVAPSAPHAVLERSETA